MKFLKTCLLFCIGGSAYVGLELLYRRRSHVSMFAAGGLCFLIIGWLRKLRLSFLSRVGLGALSITGVELATGLAVNRDHRVWDYRGMKGNVKGQICPLFMILWIPVTMLAMGLHTVTERVLKWQGGVEQ